MVKLPERKMDMKRKQYERKMMQLQRNIDKYAKENGLKRTQKPDRVSIPNFGSIIKYGKYQGQVLRSYKQSWDMVYDVLKNTDLMKGIKA